MSKIENCGNCGGTHYGSVDCPYLEKNMGEPCAVCGERTSYCCSDCAIDGAGKVYVCITDACRTEHEKKHRDVRRPPQEQIEKVRRAIFNVLSGEAEVNTGMMLEHVAGLDAVAAETRRLSLELYTTTTGPAVRRARA